MAMRDKNSPAEDDVRRSHKLRAFNPSVHQSHMACLWQCPRRYMFRYRLGLRLRFRLLEAPEVGTAFHKMLEILYKGGTMESAYEATVAQAGAKCVKIRKEAEPLNMLDVADGMCERAMMATERGIVMARIFWEVPKHRLDPEWYTVVGTEIGLHHIPMRNIKHRGSGTIDLLWYSARLKGLFIWDHKTVKAGDNLDEYSMTLSYNFQARWYRVLLDEALKQGILDDEVRDPQTGKTHSLSDLPIVGFILSCMVKPGFTHKEWQTDEQYLKEMEDFYAGRKGPTINKKGKSPFKLDGTPKKGYDEEGYLLDEEGARKEYTLWDHSEKADVWAKSPPYKQALCRFNEAPWNPEVEHLARMTANAARIRPLLSNFPRYGQLNGSCRSMYGTPCPNARLCGTSMLNWGEILAKEYEVVDPDPEVEVAHGS